MKTTMARRALLTFTPAAGFRVQCLGRGCGFPRDPSIYGFYTGSIIGITARKWKLLLRVSGPGLGIQVYKSYLHWALKSVNLTYIGLCGSQGFGMRMTFSDGCASSENPKP